MKAVCLNHISLRLFAFNFRCECVLRFLNGGVVKKEERIQTSVGHALLTDIIYLLVEN